MTADPAPQMGRPARNLGQYVLQLLSAYGVRHVFGIPGVHNAELYRGFASVRSLTHVTPRHEQGAGFMADGYARVTGRPGVCFVISGPGLTNIATAMAQAHADSIAMLVISTCLPAGRRGSGNGYLHELADQQALARQMAAFSHTLQSIEEAPTVFDRAFALFSSARPRPVHIDIPTDLLAADASHLPEPLAQAAVRPAPPPQAIARAAARIDASRQPLILAGGGARQAPVQLAALAQRIDAPVCLTVNARGLLPVQHALAISHSASLPGIRALVAQSDCVIAVGTELGPTDYDMYDDGGFRLPGESALIRIDIEQAQLQRNARSELPIASDAAQALHALSIACGAKPAGGGAQRAAQARAEAEQNLSPTYRALAELLAQIRRAVPDIILVGDSTQLSYAGCLNYAANTPGSWFSSSTGYGTLGYALPAAIGAWLGCAALGSARPVMALVGDGGIQFCLAELGSAVQAGSPVLALLWNNSGYGEIKSYMRNRGIEPQGVELFTPDFARVATAYGWRTAEAATPAGLLEQLAVALASGQPTLLQVDETRFLQAMA